MAASLPCRTRLERPHTHVCKHTLPCRVLRLAQPLRTLHGSGQPMHLASSHDRVASSSGSAGSISTSSSPFDETDQGYQMLLEAASASSSTHPHREPLARLLNPEYRAQVEAFQRLVTPENLPLLEDGLSEADLQQLRVIISDMEYLKFFPSGGGSSNGNGQDTGFGSSSSTTSSSSTQSQAGDAAYDSSSGGEGSEARQQASRMSGSGAASTSQASGTRPAASEAVRQGRPTLEELHEMQQAKIAVQQLPLDFRR